VRISARKRRPKLVSGGLFRVSGGFLQLSGRQFKFFLNLIKFLYFIFLCPFYAGFV
jgi:hypothetical protein